MNSCASIQHLLIAAALSFILQGAAFALPADEETPVDIGSRRELFVDEFLIGKMQGASLKLHPPTPDGDAIAFDKPWEGRFAGYVTVLKDQNVFRMYYRGLPRSGADGSALESTCYAESADGAHWEKPELGIYEVNGTRKNNVVLKNEAPCSHNFSPFIDTNPTAPLQERYKALAGTSKTGLVAFVSADALHWKRARPKAVIRKGAFDSQNVSFWSESEGLYLCYFRTWDGSTPWSGFRSISRVTSKDFISWSEPKAMTYGGTPREHLYTNQTHPYFRAPHIYLSVAARFMPGRRVLTPAEAKAIDVDPGYFSDCSDAVLMSTRGGGSYQRTFMEAFIRPGTGLENWVSRTNYPALGIVPLSKDKLAIHIQKHYGQPGAKLARYTLRTDGFVSVNGPYAGGEMTTRLMSFQPAAAENSSSCRLLVNCSTGAAGSLRVEILDRNGKPFPGYSLEDSREFIGDFIERAIEWKKGTDVMPLAGKAVRLRFVLKDADLYSIRFQ
ncbi:MAG: hypothetical protein VCD34_04855 [Planctomycetota bacterium]